MDKNISATELHTKLSEVLRAAIDGNVTHITYHGIVVASVVPARNDGVSELEQLVARSKPCE